MEQNSNTTQPSASINYKNRIIKINPYGVWTTTVHGLKKKGSLDEVLQFIEVSQIVSPFSEYVVEKMKEIEVRKFLIGVKY